LGIAASTAILGNKTREQLAGILSPAQLASLQHSSMSLTETQAAAVRHAYADAFRDDMILAAAVSGAAILLTALAYRRNRLTMEEQRKVQIKEEVEQRRASKSPVLRPSTD
jgi:hypothetical protein